MDNLTKAQRRKNMRNIRSTGTKPERLLAKALHSYKFLFTQHAKNLPGKPDIVFRKKKVAVFIDSDFWHGHPKRFIMPSTNTRYWREKICSNKLRDKLVTKLLKKSGWKVLRFWEYDVKKNTQQCIKKVFEAIENNK